MVGIVSYGIYIPKIRIKIEEIAKFSHLDVNTIKNSIGVLEKSIPDFDEDSLTMAYQAALNALSFFDDNYKRISACFVGSESKPYAVKPTSSFLVENLNLSPFSSSADLEFACKAGSQAMQIIYDMVRSSRIEFGLAVGTDNSQAKSGDLLELSVGAGAAAFIIGNKDVIAEIVDSVSFCADKPDFWREEHSFFPEHREGFSGSTYFETISNVVEKLLKRNSLKINQIDQVVFHMPNAVLPVKLMKKLGFNQEQFENYLTVKFIGNTYSASCLIGLASALDNAKPDTNILCVSYGSGAGSDGFFIRPTKKILEFNAKNKFNFEYFKKNKIYTDYANYLILKKMLKK